MQLLELRVAGQLLTPTFANNSCTIKLAPVDERQVLEIVFASDTLVPARAGSAEFAAPFLQGIDFTETIWLVGNAPALGPATIVETAGMPRLTAVHRDVPSVLDARAIGAASTATRFDFSGNAPQIVVRFGSLDHSTVVGRWVVAVLLGVAGLVFGRPPLARLGKPTAPALVVAGVAAGLLASVWLTPGWIGVLIALVSVAMGYRRALEKSFLPRAQIAAGEPSA